MAAATGLSVRMIRYYEPRGWFCQARTPTGQRRYSARDVARLRILRALLAAGVAADLAAPALDGGLTAGERAAVRHSLAELAAEVAEATQHVHPAPREPVVEPPDHRMAVTFDTFLARTRVESLVGRALRPVGLSANDYTLLSLLVVDDGLTPAAITRLVGNAPSTITGRLDRMLRQGWIRRTSKPAAPRSWRVELTDLGRSCFEAAYPHAEDTFRRLNEALVDAGIDVPALRTNLARMASVVRSLL